MEQVLHAVPYHLKYAGVLFNLYYVNKQDIFFYKADNKALLKVSMDKSFCQML